MENVAKCVMTAGSKIAIKPFFIRPKLELMNTLEYSRGIKLHSSITAKSH